MTARLSAEEIERYGRHIVLPGIGGPGQGKLKAARVAVIGAGGLGSPLVLYLAAAGIGEIAIIDDDVVSLSNLQRQIAHGDADIGRDKVASAADAMSRINPHVRVTPVRTRLDAANAQALLAGYDAVADGSDNFETRYAVSDACFHVRVPLVTGAVGAFDGSLTTLKPYEKAADGVPNPTWRCLFPQAPAPGIIPPCSEAGVLGALTGVIGAMMALEIIRAITTFGDSLVGKLLLADLRDMRFETVTYAWDPENALNGSGALGLR